ncbi:MAG: hypothetical protein FWC36_10585 [Spirochaetes bacterium]|nr:hypothetical protein [Spirochaetota bacterium]
MDAITIRRELKQYIDKIPESNLEIVRPMLSFLAMKQDDRLVIETNLTASEKAVIKAGRKERKEHPENFTSWAAIKAESINQKKTKK